MWFFFNNRTNKNRWNSTGVGQRVAPKQWRNKTCFELAERGEEMRTSSPTTKEKRGHHHRRKRNVNKKTRGISPQRNPKLGLGAQMVSRFSQFDWLLPLTHRIQRNKNQHWHWSISHFKQAGKPLADGAPRTEGLDSFYSPCIPLAPPPPDCDNDGRHGEAGDGRLSESAPRGVGGDWAPLSWWCGVVGVGGTSWQAAKRRTGRITRRRHTDLNTK